MALSHLVDTSVLTRLGRPGVREVVEPMARAGHLGRPGICDLEIGCASGNAEEWDRLLGALDAFESVETSTAHVARALQVQRLLAARSQRGRKLPDLLGHGRLIGALAPGSEAGGSPCISWDRPCSCGWLDDDPSSVEVARWQSRRTRPTSSVYPISSWGS